jgi:hypothetical protein
MRIRLKVSDSSQIAQLPFDVVVLKPGRPDSVRQEKEASETRVRCLAGDPVGGRESQGSLGVGMDGGVPDAESSAWGFWLLYVTRM